MLFQEQSQTQQQRIDPKIILQNTMLQLSGMELQQSIEQELAENPALEMEDEQPCSGCELAPFLCKDCQYNRQNEEDPTPEDAVTYDDVARVPEPEYTFDFNDPEDQNDPIALIRSDITLQEHLRNQLGSVASGKMHEIGDYLINYVDESGYLKCDLLEITLELDASDEELVQAVELIQTLDPPGVGARDLRECMTIQLRYLSDEGRGNKIAERIVDEFWDEMKNYKVNRIARRLKVKTEQVEKAIEFIQTKLTPYPAAGFRLPWDNKPSDIQSAIRPDVIIHRTPIGYEIEIVTNEHISLTVNPYYRQMYSEMKNGKSSQYTEGDRKHVMEHVERADLFIRNINQRRKTLKSITKYIAEYELGFLETGTKLFLRPITRVKVARALGMHESTVSRATASKYVQLPNEEVVPFEFFFQSSHSIGDMIAQMIGNEDPSNPLSDQEIADTLTAQGYAVARRTVVKYREARKILSSRQRRR